MAIQLTLKHIYSQSWVIFTSATIAIFTFALSIWLRNLDLITTTFTSPLFSTADSLLLMWRLLGGIVTDATPLAAILIITTSILFGFNASLFAYYVHRKRHVPQAKESTTALGGLIAAIFGVGCASCGTFILGALVSSAGAGSLMALLPLGGHEFLILSVGLLLISIYSLTRSIESSNLCVIPSP